MIRKAARIAMTESEIARALLPAKRMKVGALVTSVAYRSEPDLELLILNLSNGRRFVIPAEDVQGLRSATKEQISRVEIIGGGTGLHWLELDLDLYVPSLLQGVYGNKQWMAKIGANVRGQIKNRQGFTESKSKKRIS